MEISAKDAASNVATSLTSNGALDTDHLFLHVNQRSKRSYVSVRPQVIISKCV